MWPANSRYSINDAYNYLGEFLVSYVEVGLILFFSLVCMLGGFMGTSVLMKTKLNL